LGMQLGSQAFAQVKQNVNQNVLNSSSD
jgi:hypothetical protein